MATSNVRCWLCPKKGCIKLTDSVSCPGCGAHYHKACSSEERAGRFPNGFFKKCCGSRLNPHTQDPLTPRSASPIDVLSDNQTDQPSDIRDLWCKIRALMEDNTRIIHDELRTLSHSVESVLTRIDCSEARLDAVEESISNVQAKVNDLDGKLSNALPTDEATIIAEINERMRREKNIILYNVPENSADGDDYSFVQKLFVKCPYDINNIIVHRLGKSMAGGRARPLLVTFQSLDHVAWVFKNHKNIFTDNIKCSSDKTPKERNHFKMLVNELKQRTKGGEKDLTIKYRNGIPIIVKSKLEPVTSSKN